MTQTHGTQEQDAGLAGAALKRSGRTLAVAESLTGGLLASVFARASGSSEWFLGGVVPIQARSSMTSSTCPTARWSAPRRG
jgi:nicotinamide mononucleotide (NMN) deamidase PncC